MSEVIDINTPEYEFIVATGRTYFIHLESAIITDSFMQPHYIKKHAWLWKSCSFVPTR